jgi:hypothetical protein
VAENFDTLGTQRIVQLVGGTQVVDADQVMIQTKPSGIVFPLIFNPGEAVPGTVQPLAEHYATQLELALADAAVAGIVIVQDVNASNQLVDVMEITAVSTSGRSSRVISSPIPTYDSSIIINVAQAAQKELDALEAL